MILRLLLLAVVGAAWPARAEHRLVSIGSRRLSIDCEGPQSRPGTVILLAGGGRTAKDWEKVQPAVSGVTRVCSYDIAGMGESDKPPHDQSLDEIVDDLRVLLKAAGEKPPYVLTGHSIAGLYCRRFATRFPDEVSGLVFVDSSHEEQFARLRQIVPDWPPLPPDMRPMFFEKPDQRLRWETQVPLIVLAHGKPGNRPQRMTEDQFVAFERAWRELQQDLAKRSPKGRFQVAEESGHFIQTAQPALVIQAIRDVIGRP
jgi:pimeloyl-ACP methyl ester carboxylesterase